MRLTNYFRYLVTALLCIAFNAHGAKITFSNAAGRTIHFLGRITHSDAKEMERLLSGEPRPNALPVIVYVDSPGGNWDAAMQIGKLLRKSFAWVTVDNGEKCLSACVLLLAGAPTRIVFPNARIGIHRPFLGSTELISFEEAQKFYRLLEASARMYLRDMNMPDSLFDAMVRIPPEKMRLLSADEIAQYRLDQNDPALQEVEDADSARRWGLTKMEYLVRKEQVAQRCDPLLPRNNERPGKGSIEKQKAYFACRDDIMNTRK